MILQSPMFIRYPAVYVSFPWFVILAGSLPVSPGSVNSYTFLLNELTLLQLKIFHILFNLTTQTVH